MKNLFCGARVMVSVLAALVAMSNAKAACGIAEHASETTAKVPFVAQSAQSGDEESAQSTERNESILGLWHVAYVMSDGTPFYQSFKFWHPDGTEWESASASPLIGNVCLGVWREIRPRNVRLHHVGWTFVNGILTGSFTLDETDTVARGGGNYTGTFVFTTYDVNGNFSGQLQGTLKGERITVDSTGAP